MIWGIGWGRSTAHRLTFTVTVTVTGFTGAKPVLAHLAVRSAVARAVLDTVDIKFKDLFTEVARTPFTQSRQYSDNMHKIAA